MKVFDKHSTTVHHVIWQELCNTIFSVISSVRLIRTQYTYSSFPVKITSQGVAVHKGCNTEELFYLKGGVVG